MSASIALNVSRTGTIRSMADQFTSGTTFLQELLQNARRAGATEIQMRFDGRELVIEDNGHGINDPQTLLCIGESNWSNLQMVAEENPFGIGFASALFAADHIAVASSDWEFATSTSNLLDFKPVALTTHDTQREGTRIVMTLKESLCKDALGEDQYRDTLSYMTAAFPLPVYLNGTELERPLATLCEQQLSHDIPCGRLYEEVLPPAASHNAVVVLTLQGFIIDVINPEKPYHRHIMGSTLALEGQSFIRSRSLHTPRAYDIHQINRLLGQIHSRVAVVALDSQKVRSRVPDRAMLIDHDKKIKEICEEIVALRQSVLEQKKAELSATAFVDQHFQDAIRNDAAHLLNDLPLPGHELLSIVGVEASGSLPGACDKLPAYVGPESDYIFVKASWALSDVDSIEGEAQVTLLNSYLRNSPKPVLTIECAQSLHPDHWIFERTIDADDAPTCFHISAEAVDRITSFTETLEICMRFPFVVCERVLLSPLNEQLAPVESSTPCLGKDGIFYVSRHATYCDIESALLAISTYGNDDDGEKVNQDMLNEDMNLIMQMIDLSTGASKPDMIKRVLERRLNLIGQQTKSEGVAESYSISFNTDGSISVA